MIRLSIAIGLTSGLLMLACAEKELGPTFKTWVAGDRVPGYVLDYPSGSSGDVEASGSLSDGWWKLEIGTPLLGGVDDHDFVIGTEMTFSLYVSDGPDIDGTHVLRLVWDGGSGQDTVDVYDLRAHGIESPVVDGGRDGIWDSAGYCLANPEPVEGDAGIETLYVHSMHDSTYIYFFLSWPDGSADVEPDVWQYDGHDFAQSGAEDMVVFVFPTDNPPGSWSTNGAAGFYPEPGHPPDGEVNLWLWGAGRTNPLGYAEDRSATPAGWEPDAGDPPSIPNYETDVNHPLWVQDPRVAPSLGDDFLLIEEAIRFEETLRP